MSLGGAQIVVFVLQCKDFTFQFLVQKCITLQLQAVIF